MLRQNQNRQMESRLPVSLFFRVVNVSDSAFLGIGGGGGSGVGGGEHQPELHHPDYDFPDDLIEPAAQLFFRLATEKVFAE